MTLGGLLDEFSTQFEGDILTDIHTLDEYSSDASPFRIPPSAVVYPKNSADIQKLVIFANKKKAMYPDLSLTVRGAGMCVSGGPINDSIIIDTTRYMTNVLSLEDTMLTVSPGVSMREINLYLARHNRMIGASPIYSDSYTIGGMIGNNSSGEMSSTYGNISASITELTVVLADGKEHRISPMSKKAVMEKIKEGGFIGNLYKELLKILRHYDESISHIRPRVTLNASGYNLWDVYDETTKLYNFAKILCGSQGTLGIVTLIKISTEPIIKHRSFVILHVEHPKKLQSVASIIRRHKPLSIIGFNDIPLRLRIKYFNNLKVQLGSVHVFRKTTHQMKKLLSLNYHKTNIVIIVEMEGKTTEEALNRCRHLESSLKKSGARTTLMENMNGAFWKNRQANIALISQKIHSNETIPFVDDMTIEPRFIAKFIPKLQKLLYHYQIPGIISGDFINGNFHVTPIIYTPPDQFSYKYEAIMRDLTSLVQEYHGTLTSTNGDGLVRGPWLHAVYGELAFEIFRNIKQLFDPMEIFNPHKKISATLSDSRRFLDKDEDTDDLIIIKNS